MIIFLYKFGTLLVGEHMGIPDLIHESAEQGNSSIELLGFRDCCRQP